MDYNTNDKSMVLEQQSKQLDKINYMLTFYESIYNFNSYADFNDDIHGSIDKFVAYMNENIADDYFEEELGLTISENLKQIYQYYAIKSWNNYETDSETEQKERDEYIKCANEYLGDDFNIESPIGFLMETITDIEDEGIYNIFKEIIYYATIEAFDYCKNFYGINKEKTWLMEQKTILEQAQNSIQHGMDCYLPKLISLKF